MNKEDKDKLYVYESNGILTSRNLTENGIHRGVLQKLVDEGEYYRVTRGVYVKNDEWEDEFYIIQQRYRRGIFSHDTSLYLNGYSDAIPQVLHLTFPQGYNAPAIYDIKVKITRTLEKNYLLGKTELKTPSGNTVIAYDIERSLCDMLRGTNNDIQVIQPAIKKYIASRDRDINKLLMYSKQLRVEPKVRKYLEVLL